MSVPIVNEPVNIALQNSITAGICRRKMEMKKEIEIISADISEDEVKKLMAENYDIICEKNYRMDGYDDLNIRILPPVELKKNNGYTKKCENGYVLKIINHKDSSNTDFLNEYVIVLLHLRKQQILCPCPIPNNKGEYTSKWSKRKSQDEGNCSKVDHTNSKSLRVHAVILLEYISGDLLDGVNFGEKFCYSLGQQIGKLHNALKSFNDSSTLRRPNFPWSLNYVGNILQIAEVVEDETKRCLAVESIEDFQKNVLSQLNVLEQGIIHGDLNKANLLITRKEENDLEICGIIDFSDISYSCYLFDIAITITYLCLDNHERLEDFTASLISGYCRKLTDLEFKLLKICICTRLSQSLILGLHAYKSRPTNTYLLQTQKQGWTFLKKLKNMCNEEFVGKVKNQMERYRQQFS